MSSGIGNFLPFLAPLAILAPELAPELFLGEAAAGAGADAAASLGPAFLGADAATAGAGFGASLGAEAAAGVGAGALEAGAGALGTDLASSAGPAFLGADSTAAGSSLGGLADSVLGSGAGASGGAGAGAADGVGGAVGGTADATGGGTAAGGLGTPSVGSPSVGATTQTITDPFSTGGANAVPGLGGGTPVGQTGALESFGGGDTSVAGGAPSSVGDTTAYQNYQLTGGQTGGFGDGAQPSLPGSTPSVDPSAAGGATPAGGPVDYSFADQSGAFGGLGGAAPPTTADFPSSGLFSGIKDFYKANKDWLNLGGAGLSVGRSLLQGNQPPGGQANNDLQRQILQQLLQNQQALASGTLTPEQYQQIQNDLQAHLAGINSKYGSLGMSGSTAQLQDQAAAEAQATGQAGQLQQQRISQGFQQLGLAAPLANQLTQQQIAQDEQLSNAIAALAAAGMAV